MSIHLKNYVLFFQITKQYELDFRNRGKSGLKIQSSVKNFQLTLEVSKLKNVQNESKKLNDKY